MNTVTPSALALCLLLAASRAVAQDALIVPDATAPSGESLLLPLSVDGPSAVVAMQFDIRFTKSVVDVLAPLPAGASNHRAMSRELGEGVRRVVVFSRSNAVLPKDVVIDLPMVMSANVPGQPAPMLRIEGLCFALEDGTKITPVVQRGPIASWYFSHFTLEELENPAIYGDDSDPDFDNLPNLMEYAVGGSPTQYDGPLQPVTVSETGPGGERLWEMTYWESKTATGVVVEPQLSANLIDWIAVPAVPTGVEDAFFIELAVTVDLTGVERQFIRLNVRRSE